MKLMWGWTVEWDMGEGAGKYCVETRNKGFDAVAS